MDTKKRFGSRLAPALIGLLVVVLIAVAGYISLKNSAVRLENQTEEAWGNVQNAYQKRNDMYSSFLSTIKGAAAQEKSTLTAVINARAAATNANAVQNQNKEGQNPNAVAAAENNLSSAMSRLLVVVERYPELTSQQGYLNFQNNIESTENEIRVARTDYNSAVRKYNDKIATFPGSILGKDKKPLFNATTEAQHVPDLSSLEKPS